MLVEYTFTMSDGAAHHFQVRVDRPPARANPAQTPAPWTALGFHQCANCPLNAAEHPHCPVALDLEEIARRFQAINALESVTVEVKTPERTYIKYCEVHTGLCALLGLVMASSACPITSQLKSLSYYHLPFANAEETIFRAVSAYLMRQYFVQRAGGKPDLELAGLRSLYEALRMVNQGFQQRLDAAGENDANIKAINSLGFLSAAVATSLDDTLENFRPNFANLLETRAA